MRSVLISFTLLLLSWNASAQQSTLILRSLSHSKSKKITPQSLNKYIFIAFQEDCSACKKQIQDLNCLEKFRTPLLIGAFSSEYNLRKEYRKLNTPYEGYYGDKKILKTLSLHEPLTPSIFLMKNKKGIKFLGYTPCEKILSVLKKSIISDSVL